jgi:hypothetical protein
VGVRRQQSTHDPIDGRPSGEARVTQAIRVRKGLLSPCRARLVRWRGYGVAAWGRISLWCV